MSVASNQWHVGLVGYGEVGRILAEDLRKDGVRVSAYDIKLDDDRAKPLRDHAADIGVALASSHADLAAQADLIVSAVTASQAVPVAQACAARAEARRLVPRLQFGLAGRQATRRGPDRRRRRTLCRGRRHDLAAALPHQGAVAAGRLRRARAFALADRTRVQRQGCQRPSSASPRRSRCAAAS